MEIQGKTLQVALIVKRNQKRPGQNNSIDLYLT